MIKRSIRKFIRKYVPHISLFPTNVMRKVFCISMQRTGTTSVGKFFQDFGFLWAGWPADRRNAWSHSWYEGDYEKIFNSLEFKSTTAYEDSPWFLPGFYKVLYHRFPGAKFILFTREPDAWFQSMIRHSKGNVLGRSRFHSKVYRRELEFFDLLQTGIIDEVLEDKDRYGKTMKISLELADHYKAVYNLHTVEVQDFFHRYDPEALFIGSLEDPEKWQKLGKFLNIKVPDNYESHENKSKLAGV
jgi:hypothetical protein